MRTCVVTGSASGIGAATRHLLLGQGVRVVGVDRHEADVTVDLAVAPQRQEAVAEIVRVADGRVDAVVACAGMWSQDDRPVRVNYFGVVEVLEALRPVLAAGVDPGVVVVSSAAIDHRSDQATVEACLAGDEEGAANAIQRDPRLAYSSSKRALARWVRRMAPTPAWAGAGITLNAVAPGTIETPMTAAAMASERSRAMVDRNIPMPLGGHGRPEQVAALLAWLAGPENTIVTGQVVFADGGADAVLRGDDLWPT